MGAPETGWFRTESGTILEMDLPLSEPIAQRVKYKEIVRVMQVTDPVKGERWVPWEEPEDDEDAVSAEPEAAFFKALAEAAEGEIAELRAALAAVTKERDDLLEHTAKLETELARERDELKAEVSKPAKAATRVKPGE